jgi:tRNA-Thr(GGU) m(6)t(6)A37 methyltransferase TsaA
MIHHYPPIGTLRTCFTEKFGAPRQPLLVPEARGILKLNPDPEFALAFDQLATFSHIWILFVFHQHLHKPWHPRIRPPRMDGPRKVGVFASRSPHRPNPIGMSVVKLEKINLEAEGGIEIHFSGVDILDGTPVLDIKPYLPYADSVPEATSGWAAEEITKYPVHFSAGSLSAIERVDTELFPNFRGLVEQMLSLDPRPTSQRKSMPILDPKSEGMIFGFRVSNFDVKWRIQGGEIFVVELLPVPL